MIRSLAKKLGGKLAPKAGEIAPGPVATLVHRALDRAITGVGPLDGAAAYAEKALQAIAAVHGHDLADDGVRNPPWPAS